MSSRHRIPLSFAAPLLRAWIFLVVCFVLGSHRGNAEETRPKGAILAYEVDFFVGRDGRVETETRFRIPIDGERIQRGPVLDYLTAFEGPGGLILDAGLEVLSLERDGESEAFHVVDHGGIVRIYCGEESVLLAPGIYEYRLRIRTLGTWSYRDGLALAVFDATEPFREWRIESARARLFLPEGVVLQQFTPAVAGVEGGALGYRVVEGANALTVETVGPLAEENFFVLNAVWRGEGFQGRSRWLEVMRQHPRLPLSAGAGGVLVVALVCLLCGGRFRSRRGAASSGTRSDP